MPNGSPKPSLSLKPISAIESGDTIHAFCLPTDQSSHVGRSTEADWPIPDPTVSRRHASIAYMGEAWFLSDLSSRHGTYVNDRQLVPGTPIMLQAGDIISFGSWRCRCVSGSARPGMTTPFKADFAEGEKVHAISHEQLDGVAQRGLNVLMDLTVKLESSSDRQGVAAAAVAAVHEATRCRRVVIVEQEADDELVVLASTTQDAPKLSRSLIDQASRLGLVQLTVQDGQSQQAQSIMDLGIRSAICASILVAKTPVAFMMIDTRDTEGVVPKDAAAFCHSVSRLAGLAFERISAASMAERHRQLESDLEAARRAQELLSPPTHGQHGAVSYHFESIPGRVVAGDLFDIFPLDSNRTAFFLGDVSGKGVGAAMLMAACQSQLRSQLLSGIGIAAAMNAVNADLHARTETSKFVTLIAGVLDADSGALELLDAGHGLCVLIPSEGVPQRIQGQPGFPLGVVDTADYQSHTVRIADGDELLLFSDGAVEQPNPTGLQFGIEGVLAAASRVGAGSSTLKGVMDEVQRHANGPFADDMTIASIQLSTTQKS